MHDSNVQKPEGSGAQPRSRPAQRMGSMSCGSLYHTQFIPSTATTQAPRTHTLQPRDTESLS